MIFPLTAGIACTLQNGGHVRAHGVTVRPLHRHALSDIRVGDVVLIPGVGAHPVMRATGVDILVDAGLLVEGPIWVTRDEILGKVVQS